VNTHALFHPPAIHYEFGSPLSRPSRAGRARSISGSDCCKSKNLRLFARALSLDIMGASALEQNQRWLRECLIEPGEERFSLG